MTDFHTRLAAAKKVNFIGIHTHALSFDEFFGIAEAWLERQEDRSISVACVNVNCCVSALLENLQDLYGNADIRTQDSQPFVLWTRAFFYRKADRLDAPSLMLEGAKRSAEKAYRFYLYGGREGVPEKMEAYLKEMYPAVNIVGKYSPPFRALSEKEDAEISRIINDADPDFLWVGLGSPKQDMWIADHRDKIKGAVIIASGATFDFFSGEIKKAPKWVSSIGFEWFYRLCADPRRLWKRYTVYNGIFLFNFLLQLSGLKNFGNKKKG